MQYNRGLFHTRMVQPGPDEEYPLEILEAAGYVKSLSSGFIALLPPALIVLNKIYALYRAYCLSEGFGEMFLPSLQEAELWERSGRAERFAGTYCTTSLRNKKEYIVNPTQEVAVLDLFGKSGFTSKELSIRYFLIGEKTRNEMAPGHGLIRSRSFIMGDMYAITQDEEAAKVEGARIERVFRSLLSALGLPTREAVYLFSPSGMPVKSFWMPSVSRQCEAYVCNSCSKSFRLGDAGSDSCPFCGERMKAMSAVEICDIACHGKDLAQKLGVSAIDNKKPIYLTTGGIGFSRLIQLLAEYYHDEQGLVWPAEIAPFQIHLIATPGRLEEAGRLAQELERLGCEILVDTRDQSLGRALVDSDLIGIPLRIVLGKKTAAESLEIKVRKTGKQIVGSRDDALRIAGYCFQK